MASYYSDWLKETVGEALAAALTSVAVKQHQDPVDHVGHYLVQYADYLEAEAKKAESMKAIKAVAADITAEEERKKVAQQAKAAEDKCKREKEEDLVASISTTTDHHVISVTVLEAVKEATKATHVYLGKRIDLPEAAPYIRYVATAAGSELVLGQTLRGSPPGAEEEEEGPSAAEGVTFKLWKELPPPAAEDQEQSQGQEDSTPKPPAFPEYLHIENVIREKGIKFFGVPKLGAYLAVPVTYSTAIHDKGISQPPAETDDDAAAHRRPVKLRKDVRMVLGLDTGGQARAFRPPEIAAALKWAKELATALEAADDQLWDEEIIRVQTYAAEENKNRGPTIEKIKDRLAEAAKALEGMDEGPARKLKDKQQLFDIAKSAMVDNRPHLEKVAAMLIKPTGLHYIRLAAASLALLGIAAQEPSLWESLRLALGGQGAEFWTRMEALSPATGGKLHLRQDIEKVRGLLEGIDLAEVEGACMESALLLRFISATLELTEALYEMMEADEAAAAAAAEAARLAAEATAADEAE